MKRRMLMKSIQNKAFNKIENIRQTITEINEQRQYLQKQKNDNTQVLNPMYQSVKATIDLKKASEVKTFNGKESIQLNSQLFEIPLMDEEVYAHKNFQEIKKNNADLLQPNRIQKQILKINEKLHGKDKPSLKLNEDIHQSEAPEILVPSKNLYKKKQDKQSSIQNRILRKQKTILRKEIEKQFNLQKSKLESQKKDHFAQFNEKIKAQQLKEQEDMLLSRKQSQALQSKTISRNISLKNSPVVRKSTFLFDNLQLQIKNNDGYDNISSSPIGRRQTSIYFGNENLSKSPQEKSSSVSSTPLQKQNFNLLKKQSMQVQNYQSLSPGKQIPLQTSQINVSDFSLQRGQISKSPLIQRINTQDHTKPRQSFIDKGGVQDERQSRSSSLQAMLDSIMEERQIKQKRQSIIFKDRIKTEVDYEQREPIYYSRDDIYYIKNQHQSLHEKPVFQNYSSTNTEYNEKFKILSKPKNEKIDLDDSFIQQIDKIKIRDIRLNQVKKKLGLIDQATLKQAQINTITKDIEQIHQDQEQEKQNKTKLQKPQLFTRNQEKRNFTFTDNISYKYLKIQAKQKRNQKNPIEQEGRNRQRSDQSFNLRSNRSAIGTEYFSPRNREEESEEGILSTNRSHNIAANSQGNGTFRSNKRDKEDSLSQSSSSHSLSFFRQQGKNFNIQKNLKQINNKGINFDNYKIQNQLTKNQQDSAIQNPQKLITHNLQESFHVKRNYLQSQNKRIEISKYDQDSSVDKQIEDNLTQQTHLINKKENNNYGDLPYRVRAQEPTISRMRTLQLSKLNTNQSDRLTNSLSLNLFQINNNNNNINQSSQIQIGIKNPIEEQINILGNNSKQLNQNRNRLHSNILNKRMNSNLQNNNQMQSLQFHPQNSLDNTNTTHQLYQAKYNIKSFFKERLELKKDFGEKITQQDKQIQACRQKVNNFFDHIIDYSEENNHNSKEIHKLIKNNFKQISSHLQNWKNELQDSNQNFNDYLALETVNNYRNASQSIVNLQE